MATQSASMMPKTVQKFKNLIPLFNRVLVRRGDLPTETKGGIVLPDMKSAKCLKGTVLAVGPGTRNDKGTLIPMTIKVGDEVMLPDYGGTKVEIEEQTYFLFRESEILAKYNE